MNGEQINFDWDTNNIRHIARHKVSPEEFEEAMRNHPVFFGADDKSPEERWYAVGQTNGLRVLILIFSYREGKIRPITAYDADRKRRQEYFEIIGEPEPYE